MKDIAGNASRKRKEKTLNSVCGHEWNLYRLSFCSSTSNKPK